MLHLHKCQIIHRDFKSPNLIIGAQWTIKVWRGGPGGTMGLFECAADCTSARPPPSPAQKSIAMPGSRFSKRVLGPSPWLACCAWPLKQVSDFNLSRVLVEEASLGSSLSVANPRWVLGASESFLRERLAGGYMQL